MKRAPYPRRPGDEFVIMADIDGTILHGKDGTKVAFNDAAALQAKQEADQVVVEQLLGLQHGGFEVRFLTGRGEALRDVTVHQLQSAGFRGVNERLHMQDAFTTWDALRAFKCDELADWQAVVYVGDQPIDAEAAAAAGAAFVHVDDFRDGYLDHLFCWQCGCTQLRACPEGCWWVNGRLCSSCHRGGNAALDSFVEDLQERGLLHVAIVNGQPRRAS